MRRRVTGRITVLVSLVIVALRVDAQGTASFVGKVFADTTMRPLSGVEVTIPELSKSTLTDQKGAFRIRSLPGGTYVVRARVIGYARYEARVEFLEHQSTERAIVLPRITVLDSVRVVGEVDVPLSFLEHRAIGFGHFLTRADLAQQGERHLSGVLATVPGLAIAHGRTNQGWVLSKRAPPTMKRSSGPGQDLYIPGATERSRGIVAGCYARVYLDRTLLNASTPAEPVNINEFVASGIEAIEYYAGPSQTPSRYSRLNSTCGVLVLHTRRSP